MQNARTRDSEDYTLLDQDHKGTEHHAVRLAAAWSDFEVAEQAAIEIVRRFGAIEARDYGLMRLHKHPLFAALQIACVISYTRPFAEANRIQHIAAKYAKYSKPEWQEFHDELFVWRTYLSGESTMTAREFVVAHESPSESGTTAAGFVIGEASAVLDPFKDFQTLREMCANRKAMIWFDLQDAVAACYPVLPHPVLLSLGGPTSPL